MISEKQPIARPLAAAIEVADTGSMRKFLIAGMKDVMAGTITTWQAKAACNFAQQIYNVTALEVKVMLAQAKLNGQQIKTVSFIGADQGTTTESSLPTPAMDVAEPSAEKLPGLSSTVGAPIRQRQIRGRTNRAKRQQILDAVQ